jgi:hypothetical protein
MTADRFADCRSERLGYVGGSRGLASDEGGESGGLPVRVQMLRTMTADRFADCRSERLGYVGGSRGLASDEGGESGGLPVRVQM